MVRFCLFEIDRHSPFGRDHKTSMQNQQQDFAPIFFYKFFKRLFLPFKMTQTGQGLRPIFTEDGDSLQQAYFLNKLYWLVLPNMVSQWDLVPSKLRIQGYVKMRKGEKQPLLWQFPEWESTYLIPCSLNISESSKVGPDADLYNNYIMNIPVRVKLK